MYYSSILHGFFQGAAMAGFFGSSVMCSTVFCVFCSCDDCLMYQLFRHPAPWCELDSLVIFSLVLGFPLISIETWKAGRMKHRSYCCITVYSACDCECQCSCRSGWVSNLKSVF